MEKANEVMKSGRTGDRSTCMFFPYGVKTKDSLVKHLGTGGGGKLVKVDLCINHLHYVQIYF